MSHPSTCWQRAHSFYCFSQEPGMGLAEAVLWIARWLVIMSSTRSCVPTPYVVLYTGDLIIYTQICFFPKFECVLNVLKLTLLSHNIQLKRKGRAKKMWKRVQTKTSITYLGRYLAFSLDEIISLKY